MEEEGNKREGEGGFKFLKNENKSKYYREFSLTTSVEPVKLPIFSELSFYLVCRNCHIMKREFLECHLKLPYVFTSESIAFS